MFRAVDIAETVLDACRHTQHIAVHRRRGQVIADGADCTGGVVAYAGQLPDFFPRFRECAAVLFHNDLRRLAQVGSPAVIAQTFPALVHLVLFGVCQSRNVGEGLQKALVIALDCLNPCLLEHDLRQPYPVGLPVLSPGQVSGVTGIPRQKRLCQLCHDLFLHGFPSAHPGDDLFIHREHMRFFADLRQLFHGDPVHGGVFVRGDAQRLSGICNQPVGHVVVLVFRNGCAVFLVRPDRENVQGQNSAGEGIGLSDAGLFLCLPDGSPEKIVGTVCVTARPGEGVVDAVIDHQHLFQPGVHDESGTGKVAFCVAAPEQLCAVLFRRKEYLVPVTAFLFGFGNIGGETGFPVGHILFLHDISHVVCPFCESLFRPSDTKQALAIVFHFSGSKSVISVPCPSSLRREMVPLWQSTMCLTMDSPSPVPPRCFDRLLSTR